MAFGPQPYTALAESTSHRYRFYIYRLDPLAVSVRVPVGAVHNEVLEG
ncbi:MAG: hypothetical protein OXG97_06545 [Candidatus Poribacteria bacterium]|nr:hypothetical protein [Candidatus Poribacteria bacterium]